MTTKSEENLLSPYCFCFYMCIYTEKFNYTNKLVLKRLFERLNQLVKLNLVYNYI